MFQEIERALGRDLDHRKGPRTLDLDILFDDDRVSSRNQTFSFLIPGSTSDVSSLHPWSKSPRTRLHPVLHRTVTELLRVLTDQSVVRRLELPPAAATVPGRPVMLPGTTSLPREDDSVDCRDVGLEQAAPS